MSTFKDAAGQEWTVRFDGLLLGSLRQQHGINLADLTGADYLTIERDSSQLTVAVAHLLQDQLKAARVTREQFAANLVGQALEDALEAVWSAAESFFPPRQLSRLRSAFETLRGQWEAMGPTLLLLGQPGVPPMMADALAKTMLAAASSGSATSAGSGSATGQDASPSNAASG
jgi:hypothetical protein